MPRLPIDFSKTQMYKIVCNDLNITDIYIGHTTHWRERKSNHRSICYNEKDKRYNLKIYQTIRSNGGWDNWTMVLIEDFPCTNNLEACRRDRELTEEYDAKMNTYKPYISEVERLIFIKECSVKYRAENKDAIKEYQTKYIAENKEIIKERKAKYREKNKEIINQKQRENKKLKKLSLTTL